MLSIIIFRGIAHTPGMERNWSRKTSSTIRRRMG